MRGRCGTFSTFIDVRGSLATNWVGWTPRPFTWRAWRFQDLHRCPRKLGDELGRMDAAAFHVGGVTLSAPQARFAWQAWHFQYTFIDERELGRMDAAAFHVAGVTLSAPQARFAWQVWHFQDLHRFPRKLGDELGRMDAAAFHVAGVALSARQARFAWQTWHFQYLHR